MMKEELEEDEWRGEGSGDHDNHDTHLINFQSLPYTLLRRVTQMTIANTFA